MTIGAGRLNDRFRFTRGSERITHLVDGHFARSMEVDRRTTNEFDAEVNAANTNER